MFTPKLSRRTYEITFSKVQSMVAKPAFDSDSLDDIVKKCSGVVQAEVAEDTILYTVLDDCDNHEVHRKFCNEIEKVVDRRLDLRFPYAAQFPDKCRMAILENGWTEKNILSGLISYIGSLNSKFDDDLSEFLLKNLDSGGGMSPNMNAEFLSRIILDDEEEDASIDDIFLYEMRDLEGVSSSYHTSPEDLSPLDTEGDNKGGPARGGSLMEWIDGGCRSGCPSEPRYIIPYSLLSFKFSGKHTLVKQRLAHAMFFMVMERGANLFSEGDWSFSVELTKLATFSVKSKNGLNHCKDTLSSMIGEEIRVNCLNRIFGGSEELVTLINSIVEDGSDVIRIVIDDSFIEHMRRAYLNSRLISSIGKVRELSKPGSLSMLGVAGYVMSFDESVTIDMSELELMLVPNDRIVGVDWLKIMFNSAISEIRTLYESEQDNAYFLDCNFCPDSGGRIFKHYIDSES
jgi:hypothetical protein